MPTRSNPQPLLSERILWAGSLFGFLIAGFTGALYRWKLLSGSPEILSPTHIRHAHSHLMFFSWVIPALFLLIKAEVERITRKAWPSWTNWVIFATVLLGFLTYPPFLLHGYGPASFGTLRLPLAPIFSSWNILAWYLFIALYLRVTWTVTRSLSLRLLDLAMFFLVLSSLGAWGRLVLVRLQVQDPFWTSLMVHTFLVLFTDGWLIFALLALLIADLPTPGPTVRWGTWMLAVGLPFSVLLSLPHTVLPQALLIPAAVGGALVAIGVALMAWPAWASATPWRVPLAFLLVKAVMELGYTIPPVARWALYNGFRIPYLHILLLGFGTLGIFTAVQRRWGVAWSPGLPALRVGILILLLALIPLTGIWPKTLGGRWTQVLALWSDLLVVAIALWIWARIVVSPSPIRSEPPGPPAL